jgi:hypothetical protein
VLTSPWLILLLVDVSIAAPLIEELGKAFGARLGSIANPLRTRQDALVAGTAAGAGFAVVENLLYASLAAAFGGPWPAVLVARSLGAAVHPLATGFVMLGWWDARERRDDRARARGYLSGVGVHTLWNSATVALFVVGQAGGSPRAAAAGTLAVVGALGVAFGAWLWHVVGDVASGIDPSSAIRASDARAIAAWILVTAGALVPVAFVVLAFPSFRG